MSWAYVLGDARPRARIGVQASAAQHQGACSEVVGKILVAHADNHGITPLAPSLDPASHSQHRPSFDRDVDEVESRFGEERCSSQVGRAAMIHRSPDSRGTVGFAEPPQLATLRFKQSSGAQEERRLSRPTLAKQRYRFAGHHREIDPAQYLCGCSARARTGCEPFGYSTKLERDGHSRRYNMRRREASSLRRVDRQMVADDSYALLRRPWRSASPMMSSGGPGGTTTPPPGAGTRSTNGRSRVVRRNPWPS